MVIHNILLFLVLLSVSSSSTSAQLVSDPSCDFEFELEILTDIFPGETTWDIKDKDGNLVTSGGPYSQAQTTYSEFVCLDPELERFTFTINDSFGDGICCFFEGGSYTIKYNGVLVKESDGDFGSSEATEFPEELSLDPPTSSPTTAPTIYFGPRECVDGEKLFFIRLVTDNFPQETTWGITIGPSGLDPDEKDIVIERGYPYTEAQTVYEEYYCLERPTNDGDVYTFTIYDDNGLLAGSPKGRYEIFLDGMELRVNNSPFRGDSESIDFFPNQCFGRGEGSCNKIGNAKNVCCKGGCNQGKCP